MEPMTLGSPVGSPVASASLNQSAYMPSYLMGDPQAATTPRSNTLSPKGAGRAFGYANSPNATDFNRSALAPFGGYQQQQQAQQQGLGMQHQLYSGTPTRNARQTGPPTQSLFDSLRNDRNLIQTPTRHQHQQSILQQQQQQQQPLSPLNVTNYSHDRSYPNPSTTQFNDSYLPTAPNAFNASTRALCSPLGANMSPMLNTTAAGRTTAGADFWVTIFGFQTGTEPLILQQFAVCGTIVDKVLAPKNCNWIHIKYASRIECEKAFNFNGKIISNNIMIGVIRCTDRNIIDKENQNVSANADNNILQELTPQPKVRPLAQQAYKNAQNDTAVSPNKNIPHKNSGLVNRAMDLFFGW